MKTSVYVAELAYLKKKSLSEDTPAIDPTVNTGPDPGPNPATAEKEKPAPKSAVKPTTDTPKKENKPNTEKKDVEKQAFVGGILSDVGSQVLQKVYSVASGDIYHNRPGRVGDNPAYTGAGMGH